MIPLPAQFTSRSPASNPTSPSSFTGPPSFRDSIATLLTRSPRDECPESPKLGRRATVLRKLAGPREHAKRFLRLRSSGVPAPTLRPTPRRSVRPVSEIILPRTESIDFESEMRSDSSSATEVMPQALREDPATPDLTSSFTPLHNEKIVATGSGISVGVALTEPVLYLQGYDQHDPSSKKSAILRGQIHLKVTKCIKIKKISVCFRGHAQTDWPDGIVALPLSRRFKLTPVKVSHPRKSISTTRRISSPTAWSTSTMVSQRSCRMSTAHTTTSMPNPFQPFPARKE